MARNRPQKKKKLEVVFDPKKRAEFLTGFRKRKNERRKKAKEQLENTLKEERKRIRQEIKDGITHMKKSFEPLKELTEQDKLEDEYEDDDVKVKIVELTTNDLAAQNNFIGENRVAVCESEEEEESEDEKDDENMPANVIPGMDLVERKEKKLKNLEADVQEVGNKNKNKLTNKEIKSKKDIDRLKKTKTLNKLKKSKAFKMKERLDKRANQKKIRRDKNNTLKSLPKSGLRKVKKAGNVNRFSKGRMLSRKSRKAKARA